MCLCHLLMCNVALLRKSTASDFLQKIRAKRVSECFPGGCSTEDSEAGELIEVDVSSHYLCFLSYSVLVKNYLQYCNDAPENKFYRCSLIFIIA